MVKNKSLMRKIFRLREKAKAFVNLDTLPVSEKHFEVFNKACIEEAQSHCGLDAKKEDTIII